MCVPSVTRASIPDFSSALRVIWSAHSSGSKKRLHFGFPVEKGYRLLYSNSPICWAFL